MRQFNLGVAVMAESTAQAETAELHEGGEISGRVTVAVTKEGLGGVQVCAAGDGPALGSTCTISEPDGDYTIAGLERSAYFIAFFPEIPYLGQRYPGVSLRETAETISVVEGTDVSGIDGRLQIGGKITGRVTSASTKAPLAKTRVCADENDGERELCVITDANGEYTIAGLGTASDTV